MNFSRLAVAAALCLSAAAAPAQATPSITGTWRTDDGKTVVTIAPCNSSTPELCGRISRLLVSEPPSGGKDRNNPKESLRDRRLLGLAVFWDLKRDGAAWEGEGYTPKDGRYFDARLKAEDDTLEIRGCVMLFCRTVRWTRIV